MQSNRIMALLAVVAGLVATGLAFAYIESAAGKQGAEPMVSVLFITNDLPANHELDPDADLRTEQVGAISSPGLARAAVKSDEREALRGRRIDGPLPAGVPLMYSHLATIQDIQLSPGMRAMAIKVGREGTLGGILVPGDRVDIVVACEAEPDGDAAAGDLDLADPQAALGAIFAQAAGRSANPGRWEAREVLGDVRVVAVGSRLRLSRQQLAFGGQTGLDRGAETVTVEVTPEQALELIKATAAGRNPVTLLLRPAVAPRGSGGLVEEEGR